MWAAWFRRRKKKQAEASEPELRGAPAHPRNKTYSAETGYVYQYLYKGNRRADGIEATDFVFEATRSRGGRIPVSVRLTDADIADCERRIGRTLLNPERYALAKMTLFSAFDRLREAAEFAEPVTPDPDFMESTLRFLKRID